MASKPSAGSSANRTGFSALHVGQADFSASGRNRFLNICGEAATNLLAVSPTWRAQKKLLADQFVGNR